VRYAAVPAKFGKWVFGAGVKLLGNGGSTTASPNLEMRDNDQGIWKNWNINGGAALEDQATGFRGSAGGRI